MHLEWIQHALPRYDDLFGLLFYWQGSNQRSDFLSGLPLGKLSQTLLSSPHAGVNDLQEELSGARVEDEDRTVDGLCREVTLERLVDGHTIHIGIIYKPDDLVGEELAVILR